MKLLLLVIAFIVPLLANADPVYRLLNLKATDVGYTADITLQEGSGPYGSDIKNLQLETTFESEDTIRIKITDRDRRRWEVPKVVKTKQPTQPPKKVSILWFAFRLYDIHFEEKPFSFEIQRASSGEVLFSTRGTPFVYSDQYITIGTTFPKPDPNLYGAGERAAPFRLETNNQRYTMFNIDNPNIYKENLYGTHPFFLEFRDGRSSGAFLLNSNAQDIIVNNQSLNFITIGGIIDLFVFVGPSPSQVVKQYHTVIGAPFIPAFWSLGWHQSRFGYHNIQEVQQVVQKYKENDLPLDTIWNDIDYMQACEIHHHHHSLSLGLQGFHDRYPEDQMRRFVDKLHANNQQYIVIVDPGIKKQVGYRAYDEGVRDDIFIKRSDNKTDIVNKVWPGLCTFPDFTNPKCHQYWDRLVSDFLSRVPIDGLWLDMNEQSGFCDGECNGDPIIKNKFSHRNPPYVPGSQFGRNLNSRTLSSDAIYSIGSNYDLHNMYPLYQIESTSRTLQQTRNNKRAMILTRANFPSTGTLSAHWTGDNWSNWLSLRMSLSGILSMQLFGISFVGSDICGFKEDASYDLCARWTQVGSLYPFSRNHNELGRKLQEPYLFDQAFTNMARKYLYNRYSLLFHLYTLFYENSVHKGMVWRPLFFEFALDKGNDGIARIDEQFLLGPSLLCSPVVYERASSVRAYFPSGVTWYDYYSGEAVSNGSEWRVLRAPWDHLPLHIRSGSIIVKNTPALTSAQTKKNPIGLLVALSDTLDDSLGSLYLDDGDSLNTVDLGKYTLITYRSVYQGGNRNVFRLQNEILNLGYTQSSNTIDRIVVYGVKGNDCKAESGGAVLPTKIGPFNTLTVNLQVNVLSKLDVVVNCKP
ncbi:lysosomal alpha-glucosidase [Acrasis kona]|uniref:Maltase n=1 Tax=Acrasis kona TaxID=1008807 RepID=A0AAW2ZE75_9EUKA